jgi:hypothetical protein
MKIKKKELCVCLFFVFGVRWRGLDVNALTAVISFLFPQRKKGGNLFGEFERDQH